MAKNKIINFKTEAEVKEDFEKACKDNFTNPSAELYKFVRQYVNRLSKINNKMELENKHLAAYFPYNLKVKVYNPYGLYIGRVVAINSDGSIGISDVIPGEIKLINRSSFKIQLILNPMSNFDKQHIDTLARLVIELDSRYTIDGATLMIEEYISKPLFMPHVLVEKLLEWHFDIFGLIDEGLAVSVLNEKK